MKLAIILVAALSLLFASKLAAEDFDAKWDQASIQVGEQVVKPLRFRSDWTFEYAVAGRRFTVVGDSVHEIDGTTGEKKWTVTTDDHWKLRWLDATESTAFFLADKHNPDDHSEQNNKASIIRRLDLRTRQWLTPLLLAKTTIEPGLDRNARDVIGQVLAGKTTTIVLVFATKELPTLGGVSTGVNPNRWQSPLNYRVYCFPEGELKPRWVKEFAWSDDLSAHSCSLFSTTGPHSAESKIQYLSWLRDDQVVVCAGAKQNVLALYLESGFQMWDVSRIWEYERAFVGPSVYQYRMTRFGIDPTLERFADSVPDDHATEQEELDRRTFAEQGKRVLEEKHKEFYAQYEASIVSGPIVTRDDGSIFIAVSRGRKGDWIELLSDSTVYKLDDSGQIAARVNLPRMIEGWPQRALTNGARVDLRAR